MELIESIIIFIAGYLIGHFLATKRDKSNSFRESIKKYEKSLSRYIKNGNSSLLPNLEDMHLLSKYLYLYRKHKFESLVSDLENSVQADASNQNYDPLKDTCTIVDTNYKSQTPEIAKKLLKLVRSI